MQEVDQAPAAAPAPSEQQSFEGSPSLTRERQRADEATTYERALVDRLLQRLGSEEISPPGEIVNALDRVRLLQDAAKSVERGETDAALLVAGKSHRAVLRRLSKELTRAYSVARDASADRREANVERDAAKASDHQSYWLIMAELDAIGTAADEIRKASPDHLQTQALASAVEASACRILELIGDLLDPADRRGLHHDVGGSG